MGVFPATRVHSCLETAAMLKTFATIAEIGFLIALYVYMATDILEAGEGVAQFAWSTLGPLLLAAVALRSLAWLFAPRFKTPRHQRRLIRSR